MDSSGSEEMPHGSNCAICTTSGIKRTSSDAGFAAEAEAKRVNRPENIEYMPQGSEEVIAESKETDCEVNQEKLRANLLQQDLIQARLKHYRMFNDVRLQHEKEKTRADMLHERLQVAQINGSVPAESGWTSPATLDTMKRVEELQTRVNGLNRSLSKVKEEQEADRGFIKSLLKDEAQNKDRIRALEKQLLDERKHHRNALKEVSKRIQVQEAKDSMMKTASELQKQIVAFKDLISARHDS